VLGTADGKRAMHRNQVSQTVALCLASLGPQAMLGGLSVASASLGRPWSHALVQWDVEAGLASRHGHASVGPICTQRPRLALSSSDWFTVESWRLPRAPREEDGGVSSDRRRGRW
jgi:hypothetical protein